MFALTAERMGYRVQVVTGSDSSLDLIVPLDGALSPEFAKPASQPSVIADFVVIAARAHDGDFVSWDPIAIDKTSGALDIARSPAPIGAKVERRSIDIARDLLEEHKVIGVACVEFALSSAFEVFVQDFISGPSRYGYLTIDACVTDQFEQHLRAVCGLPLGGAELLRPAAMAVLNESIWERGEPDWAAVLALPEVKLHLYGDRKGHLTATAASGTLAKQIVRAARSSLLRS